MKTLPSYKIFVLRTIQILIVQLCCCTMVLATGSTNAQGKKAPSVKEVQIDISFQNDDLLTAIRKLEKATDYRFVYFERDLDKDYRLSTSYERKTVYDVLVDISRDTDLRFRQVNQNINIQKIQSDNDNLPSQVIIEAPMVVKGRVLDEAGEGLPGVSIVIKNSLSGTVTDIAGNYTLEVPSESSTLVFSFIGYELQEIDVQGRSTIDVVMVADIKALEEVVVVGYGTQRKSDVTGAVVSVPTERLKQLPATNVLTAIQGAVAGVSITSGNSRPDSEPNVNIRGIKSITASNAPLVVVDGIPGASLSTINQNDISSIEILKDASASAVYGSRGANGVILITTKRGTGEPQISLNVSSGVRSIIKKMDLYDGIEYLNARRDMFRLAGEPNAAVDVLSSEQFENFKANQQVDWQDEYLNEAPFQMYHLGMSGKINKTSYYVAINHSNEDHIVQNYNYKLSGLRMNFDQELREWLKVGTSMQVNAKRSSGVSTTLKESVRLTPWDAVVDSLGNEILFPGTRGFITNPRSQQNAIVDNRTNQFFNNLYMAFQAPGIEGLSYRINLGTDIRNTKNNQYLGADTPEGANVNGFASLYTAAVRNWTLTNQVDYVVSLADHYLKVTGVYEAQQFFNENFRVAAQNFPNDGTKFNNIVSAAEYFPPNSYAQRSRNVSSMGRLHYSYKEKYMLTATVRRDGYSAFGKANKFGLFPSFALGWRITEEPWLQRNNYINILKLRLAYGENGNQAIAPYSSIAKLTTGTWTGSDDLPDPRTYLMDNEIIYGFYPANLANPSLGWETTRSFNAGLDFGVFQNRISGALEYYTSRTHDLLLFRNLPAVTGFNGIMSNIGSTMNWGGELTLNARVLDQQNSLKWRLGGNIAYNRNKILELYGDGQDDVGNRWFIGKPIQIYYDYVFDGIVQEGEDMSETSQPAATPGEIKVKHFPIAGETDKQITPDDRRIIGSRIPDFIYGLNSTVEFKNFDLTIFIQGIQGVTRKNNLLALGEDLGANALYTDWWTPENQSNSFPGRIRGADMTYWSSFTYEDASYLRVKDITLGYNLSSELSQKLKVASLRTYVNLRNWFTATKWTGLDPETGDYSNPNTKSVMLGLNLTF